MRSATRVLGIGLVVAMVVAPGGIAAGKKKPRKVTRTETYGYLGAGGARVQDTTTSICFDSTCRELTPLAKDKFLSIEVADASGQPAPFYVMVYDVTHAYCGSMHKALALRGDRTVHVQIPTASVPHCAGVATSGSFTATYSNRR